ncbi:mucin TcMUCII, partial [Trypanosoma cruzi]
MQMKKQCFSWTAMRTVPRRRQLRLDAETGASRHTTQYSLVGCFHSALHHGDEAITPCPTPRAAKKDTSVHLAANPAPLRRIVGFRALTQHKRLTLLRCIEDVRSPIYSEPVPPSMHNKLAAPIALPRDAVINGLHRVCNTIAIPHSHNRAPPIQNRNFLWDTVRCNKVEFNQPRFAQDASD